MPLKTLVGAPRSRASVRCGERLTFGRVRRITIPAGSVSVNLRTLANSAGYQGRGTIRFVFTQVGALVATDAATPAITRGTFPARVKVELVSNNVKGKGGVGGAEGFGDGATGGAGGTGGTAIDASAGPLTVTNLGSIEGGTGGQGGGGGTNHSPSAGGTPGDCEAIGGGVGAAGADGGGAAGALGNNSSVDFNCVSFATAGGPGGPAGKYCVGIANVTFRTIGTVLGLTS